MQSHLKDLFVADSSAILASAARPKTMTGSRDKKLTIATLSAWKPSSKVLQDSDNVNCKSYCVVEDMGPAQYEMRSICNLLMMTDKQGNLSQ